MLKTLRADQEDAAVDKQYIVATDGVQMPLPMSQMTRKVASITKAAFKVWIHSVARQQTLGRRGMPAIWIVNPDILEQHSISDDLPEGIAEHVQQSALRRQRRSRAKDKPRMQLSSTPAAVLAAVPAAGNDRLQLLAAAGATEQQLQEAALLIQLNVLSTSAAEGGRGESLAVGHVKAPAAHSTALPKESLEESEARLEDGTLKKAIFTVLKAAGPDGLGVNEIMEHLQPLGFAWQGNERAGKSSISSTCGHSAIFLRLEAGVFTLRALPGALDRVNMASVSCSREVLEV
jgi:hypothetical protein